MAWRIDEHVIRGEIDNRTRGRVTGRIWFAGRDAPVELDLAGNAWRDVAGRRLEFINPEPKPGLAEGVSARQIGTVGDITASRKVKVPEIPLDQIGEYYAQKKPWPWHWGNSLYLEWFSDTNGRVVIESASYQLIISPDIAWEMTLEDEAAQRSANGDAMTGFMDRLGDVAGRALDGQSASDDEPATGNDVEDDRGESNAQEGNRPQTEEEADRMLADSDKLGDRIAARIDREGDTADFERILEEELERRRAERHERPPTPKQEEERARWVDEMNRPAEEALNNPDPEIEEIIQREHPLAVRAHDLASRLMMEPEQRGWIDDDTQREHPVLDLVNSGTSAAVKLAGALNGREWPPGVEECGLAISWLKRARGYLTDALAAGDACAEEEIVDADWIKATRAELLAIAAEVDAIIGELRAKLQQGFD
jgi:hypothetical protein